MGYCTPAVLFEVSERQKFVFISLHIESRDKEHLCRIAMLVWNKMWKEDKGKSWKFFSFHWGSGFQTVSLTARRCSVSHQAFLCKSGLKWWRIMTLIPIRPLFFPTMALTRRTRADSAHRRSLRSLIWVKSVQHHIKKHASKKKQHFR